MERRTSLMDRRGRGAFHRACVRARRVYTSLGRAAAGTLHLRPRKTKADKSN